MKEKEKRGMEVARFVPVITLRESISQPLKKDTGLSARIETNTHKVTPMALYVCVCVILRKCVCVCVPVHDLKHLQEKRHNMSLVLMRNMS